MVLPVPGGGEKRERESASAAGVAIGGGGRQTHADDTHTLSFSPGVPVTSMLGMSRSAGPGGAPSDGDADVVIQSFDENRKTVECPTSKNAVLQTPGRARPRRRVAGGVVGGGGVGGGERGDSTENALPV